MLHSWRSLSLWFVCCWLGLLAWSTALASEGADWLALDLESFDAIWSAVRDHHWDPEMGGLDWQAVRAELRPRAERAADHEEARAVMEEMLERLATSHYQIIPAEAYQDLAAANGRWDGETGITACVVEGRALVRAVSDGSPAADAGVRPGWELIDVDGVDVAARLARVSETMADSRWRDAYLLLVAQGVLGGAPGVAAAVQFADTTGSSWFFDIERVTRRGRKVRLGNLPDVWVWIETTRIDGGVGLIAFNSFLDPLHLMSAFNQAMESFLGAPGVVVDLRGNGGGIGAMALGMAGWFVAEKGRDIGTLATRDTTLRMVVAPRPRVFEGQVAVLVDALSASAAEFLAGGLQNLGRARVFGSRSAGAALPSVVEKLPNGDGFQYVFAHFVTASGKPLEGRGVIPDVEVALTRADLESGRDPVLDAAVAWLLCEQNQLF